MNQQIILNPLLALTLILLISISFILIGIFYSKKYKGLNNYLVANRSVGTFSLTSSLVASALGTWILFGPASAATWGGIGAVIGYSLGTAFPLFAIIFIGKIFRNSYPNAKSLIEVVRLRFGKHIFKLILILSIFYMTIFLIAEVTAVSILVPVVVAILFTVRIPNVEPLSFLPPRAGEGVPRLLPQRPRRSGAQHLDWRSTRHKTPHPPRRLLHATLRRATTHATRVERRAPRRSCRTARWMV